MRVRPLAIALLLASANAQEHPATFRSTIKPFFEAHCVKCHGTRRPKAGVDLASLTGNFDSAAETATFARALDQLQAGLMPPRKRKQPEATARRKVVLALQDAVLGSPHGRGYAGKLELPQYGNWVDHDALFSGEFDEPPFTRARIWRHSPYNFSGKRKVNKRVRGVQNPFAFSTPKNGVRDYAATSLVGASVVETSLLNAASELEWMFAEAKGEASKAAGNRKGKGKGKGKRRRANPLTPFVREGATPDAAQITAAITPTFRRLVDRDPTAEETQKYADLYRKNLEDTGDKAQSLRATLTAIYVCPEALYRMEWGLGPKDEHGRRMLNPEELANALSHALFDSGPHGGGRGPKKLIGEALNRGKLKSKADVHALVTAILGGEQYEAKSAKRFYDVPRVMRFFREFFGYDRATEVFKDAKHVGEHGLRHDPRRLVKDAENLISVILREDRNVFEELLTTNRALVFHDGNNAAPIARWEQAKRDLQNVDDEWARQQTQRRLRGVAKKPKYKNNPKLVEAPSTRSIRTPTRRTLLAEKKPAPAGATSRSPGRSCSSVKSRDRRNTSRPTTCTPGKWTWPPEAAIRTARLISAPGILTHPVLARRPLPQRWQRPHPPRHLGLRETPRRRARRRPARRRRPRPRRSAQDAARAHGDILRGQGVLEVPPQDQSARRTLRGVRRLRPVPRPNTTSIATGKLISRSATSRCRGRDPARTGSVQPAIDRDKLVAAGEFTSAAGRREGLVRRTGHPRSSQAAS